MNQNDPLPDGTMFRSYKRVANQLKNDFRLDAQTNSEGVFIHEIPSDYYISDRKYLADGKTRESYRIFFELLLNIPFVLMKVEEYFETYIDDLIQLAEIGLPQPKIIHFGDLEGMDNRLYTTIRSLHFGYFELTEEEIDERIESRRQDYTSIICIIWLINLLRSNPLQYTSRGLFRKKEPIKVDAKVIDSYKAIVKEISGAYNNPIANIIVRETFILLNIDQEQFEASAPEP